MLPLRSALAAALVARATALRFASIRCLVTDDGRGLRVRVFAARVLEALAARVRS